ncbi:hypothetical protein JN01_0498 [Entomoplasma freundtii]|uniref:Uncharacterized protein n=1 Tax=Entomoplasma freundtii TaxID=74700 RepID=A0A2K8NQJ2_9MOLU|nr:hypothetical protein [Entomoplasma freundtii]ATZ16102.1 hypothetical protein EFREU_v1c00750 [Entomoplasma freundtii]TDY56997.1 hypothetical protein JN01_0498 [Entomoplasma freundtii]
MTYLKIDEVIKKIMVLHNLSFKETQEKVFINHIEMFYNRLLNNENVGIELTETLKKQISLSVWVRAEKFINDFLKVMNQNLGNKILEVPEIELFLVATHLLLL